MLSVVHPNLVVRHNLHTASSSSTTPTDFKKASELLCKATIECIVKERFGSKTKYLRVFRLLLEKKLLDQKQVSDKAMVPNKEAKEILYDLLAEKFVSLQVSALQLNSLHIFQADVLCRVFRRYQRLQIMLLPGPSICSQCNFSQWPLW